MSCKLTFDAVSTHVAFLIFTFLVTLGLSFWSDWKFWYISLITPLALLGIVYCVWLVYDKSPWLIINESGITFRNNRWLFTRPKFIPWDSVVSYYNYTYPFDHAIQPEYLVLVFTNGKKQKITISGLDYSKDEILGAAKRYYSSSGDADGEA